MSVHLITVGDELLIGDTINTNAAWLGERFTEVGYSVIEAQTVADESDAIVAAIKRATHMASLVVVTGGLGPTHDDLTRDALAEAFETPLHFDASWFDFVAARFASRGLDVPEANRTQAMVPEGFEVLPNDQGTAPGLYGVRQVDGAAVAVAVLPGVPSEMRHLVNDRLLPRLVEERHARAVRHIGTTGIGESHLQELLGDLNRHFTNGLRLAYLPSLSGLKLRLTVTDATIELAEARADEVLGEITSRAAKYIFSTDGSSLEAALGKQLAERRLTLAIAESCTGGLVADRLTNIAGASRYILGGVVAYSNAAKVALLDVEEETLQLHGAVSEDVARQMAEGARRRFGADIGAASTGILGPGGGTPEKPVGTVWIAVADSRGTKARRLALGTSARVDNKMRASTALLNLLRHRIRDL